MKAFKVENILVFGEYTEEISLEELDKLQANPTNEYHILRHFSNVEEYYKQSLLGKNYEYYDYSKGRFVESTITESDISNAFKTTGTKFYSNIIGIENPKNLLLFIKTEFEKRIKNKDIIWICKNGNKTAKFTIPYRENIGDEDLIDINSLNNSDKQRIKRVHRDGENSPMINVIENLPKLPTNIIAVEILSVKGRPFYSITTYPSSLSPSFPNKNQGDEERKYNENYWNNHVFIV